MAVPNRTQNRGFSGAMSRRDFIRTAGVGAAAMGAASMGFGAVANAQAVNACGTPCRTYVGGFPNFIPDGASPVGSIPGQPTWGVFVKHPLYNSVIQHAGEIFECPPTSPCIPEGHGLTWLDSDGTTIGNDALADYTVGLLDPTDMKLLSYYNSPIDGPFVGGVLFTRWYMKPNDPTQYPLPPNNGPVLGMTWGQAYASNGAKLGFYFADYPTGRVPFSDVTQVPRPIAVNPSLLASVENMTTAVQFNVTCPFTASGSTVSSAQKSLKIFGWFISMRGAGYNLSDRPLVVHIGGITNYITQPGYEGNLAYVSALAQMGYDVLYIDKPGHGWSEGKMLEFHPSMLFEILNQLHGGVYALGFGEPVPSIKSLIAGQLQYGQGNAKKTKIILSGHSLGAIINQKCVVANLAPELFNLPWFQMPFSFDNRYKIVGIIDMEGLPGGMKFTSPGLFRGAAGALAYGLSLNPTQGAAILATVAPAPTSSEIVSFLSNPYMPPMMFVTSTLNWQSPANAVFAYGLHTGLKRIFMYNGIHGSTMKLPSQGGYVYNVLPEVNQFITDCLANIENPISGNTMQADLQTLVCQSLAIAPRQSL